MNKICKNCLLSKDIIDFNKGHAICKKCYNDKRKVNKIKVDRKEYVKEYNKKYYINRKLGIKMTKTNKRKNNLRYKMSGYIYIIINKAWDGYVKLGRTNNLENRLYSYQIGSPFRDYELYYSQYTDNLNEIEYYFEKNITGNYEWFEIDKDISVNIIKKIIEEQLTLI